MEALVRANSIQPRDNKFDPYLAMRCMVDGLLVVDAEGRVASTVVRRGLEPLQDVSGKLPWESNREQSLGECFFGVDTHEAIQFDLQWEQLDYGFLPADVIFDQLPREMRQNGRIFELTPREFEGADGFYLIEFKDVTTVAEERLRSAQNAQFRKVVETMMQHIEAARGFFAETRWLLEGLKDGSEDKRRRDLHTLKGNLGTFGFEDLAVVIHHAEDALITGNTVAEQQHLNTLRAGWEEQEQLVGVLFASRADREVTLSREEYEEHVMMCMVQTDHAELLGEVQRWAMDPVSGVFARLALQTQRAATAAGKPVDITIEHNLIRLPATGLEQLWANLVHLARNAVDHGIEPPNERTAAGKSAQGSITFRAETTDDEVVITVADDGRGIDWARVQQKAKDCGLAHETRGDLCRALLSDGFSTRTAADLGSGRGVGTAAVRHAIEQLDGHCAIYSEPGEGSAFEIHLPLASIATLGLLS